MFYLHPLCSFHSCGFIHVSPLPAQSLSFQVVQHVVTTMDVQPSEGGMIAVFVVGQLKVFVLIH